MKIIRAVFVSAAVLSSFSAFADSWPSRPIRFVVPFVPGGTNDYLARLFAEKLAPSLGQPVVVENKPGAAGNIGTDYVAKQPADGYTLLIKANSHVAAASLYKDLPYDPIRSFAPVSLVVNVPLVMVVNAGSGLKSGKDVAARAKEGKGIAYATAGAGTPQHFASELLRTRTGGAYVHVPYKGDGAVVTALLAGEVDFSIISTGPVMPHLRAGKLRALAVAGAKRSALLPEVPTLAEALPAPGYAMDSWIGVLMAAGTPKEIVTRMSAELAKIVRAPQFVRERLEPVGLEPVGSTPEQFLAMMKADLELYEKLARQANIRVD